MTDTSTDASLLARLQEQDDFIAHLQQAAGAMIWHEGTAEQQLKALCLQAADALRRSGEALRRLQAERWNALAIQQVLRRVVRYIDTPLTTYLQKDVDEMLQELPRPSDAEKPSMEEPRSASAHQEEDGETGFDAWRLVRIGEVAPKYGGHGTWVETNHPAVVACMGSAPPCAENGCQYRSITAHQEDLWRCLLCGSESNSSLTIQCSHGGEHVQKVRGPGAGKFAEAARHSGAETPTKEAAPDAGAAPAVAAERERIAQWLEGCQLNGWTCQSLADDLRNGV